MFRRMIPLALCALVLAVFGGTSADGKSVDSKSITNQGCTRAMSAGGGYPSWGPCLTGEFLNVFTYGSLPLYGAKKLKIVTSKPKGGKQPFTVIARKGVAIKRIVIQRRWMGSGKQPKPTKVLVPKRGSKTCNFRTCKGELVWRGGNALPMAFAEGVRSG